MNISDFFLWSFDYTRIEASPTPWVSLEEGAFPAFLKVDISQNEFEIPVPLIPYLSTAKGYNCNQLVFNLINGCDYIGRRTSHKKNISTILKEFADASANNTMRIAHIITSKGLHYYGCLGMILDASYEPLMINTLRITWNPIDDTIYMTSHPKCHFSYKVFENSAEIVEKTLIKQLIPFYSKNHVAVGPSYTASPVELLIEHTDSMVVKPQTPTISMGNPAIFNDTILHHYENR